MLHGTTHQYGRTLRIANSDARFPMIIRVRTVERRCSQYIDLRWGQSFSAVILLNYWHIQEYTSGSCSIFELLNYWIIEILNYCKFKLSSASRLWTYHLNEGAYGARAASLNYWIIQLLNYWIIELFWIHEIPLVHRRMIDLLNYIMSTKDTAEAPANYWILKLLNY